MPYEEYTQENINPSRQLEELRIELLGVKQQMKGFKEEMLEYWKNLIEEEMADKFTNVYKTVEYITKDRQPRSSPDPKLIEDLTSPKINNKEEYQRFEKKIEDFYSSISIDKVW